MGGRFQPAQIPREVRGRRVLLRAPRPHDAPACLQAQLDSRAELKRWMVWAQEAPTLGGVRAGLEGAAERFASGE